MSKKAFFSPDRLYEVFYWENGADNLYLVKINHVPKITNVKSVTVKVEYAYNVQSKEVVFSNEVLFQRLAERNIQLQSADSNTVETEPASNVPATGNWITTELLVGAVVASLFVSVTISFVFTMLCLRWRRKYLEVKQHISTLTEVSSVDLGKKSNCSDTEIRLEISTLPPRNSSTPFKLGMQYNKECGSIEDGTLVEEPTKERNNDASWSKGPSDNHSQSSDR